MGEASVEAWKVVAAKQKYWSKTLSDDAMFWNYDAMFDVFDWLSTFGDWVLSDTLWSSLVLSLLLDFKLTDIVPDNLLWLIELPTPLEFLRGVLIKLVKIDLAQLIPDYSIAFDEPWRFLLPEVAEAFEETRLRKGIYGKSPYGDSYYDPTAVREFLRSTILAFTKKRGSWPTAIVDVKTAAKTLNIADFLVDTVFDRLSAITAAKEQQLTWDYGWWDRSVWGREHSSSFVDGEIEFVTIEGKRVTLPYNDIADYVMYGFWDYAYWDYFYWWSPEDEYAHPFRIDNPTFARVIDGVWSNFRDRITATAMAVANYQTLEERRTWWKSERTDIYGFARSQVRYIERLVEGVVKSMEPNIDIYRLRLYKSAVNELLGYTAHTHRWGTEMWQSMSEEQRKRFWIEKWVEQGLNRDVLEELWSRVLEAVRRAASVRQRQRLRFLRYRLGRW